jgi:hypothetical protein
MQNNQEILLNSRHGWLGWWPRTGIKSIFDPENARIFEFLVEQRKKMVDQSYVLLARLS